MARPGALTPSDPLMVNGLMRPPRAWDARLGNGPAFPRRESPVDRDRLRRADNQVVTSSRTSGRIS
jgi:hypothetical protein